MLPPFREILGKHYELHDSDVFPGAVSYQAGVPAHQFHFVVCPFESFLALLVARDRFEKALASAILHFATTRAEQLATSRPLTKLAGFRAPGFDFDSLLVLSHESHRAFETIDKGLNLVTLKLVPAYDCEVGGHESAAEIDNICHRGPCLIDWYRKRTPLIYIRVTNKATQVRIRKRYYASAEYALHEINTLPDDDASSVIVENFRAEVVVVRRRASKYILDCAGRGTPVVVLPSEEVSSWLHAFIHGG